LKEKSAKKPLRHLCRKGHEYIEESLTQHLQSP